MQSLLAKHERRFLVDPQFLGQVISDINLIGFQEVNYGFRNNTQSLYFANGDLEVPAEYILRARRYKVVPNQGLGFKLNFDDGWFLEERFPDGAKFREHMRLDQALKLINNRSQIGPLSPIAATEWKRRHYISGGERVTVDIQRKYFGFGWGKTSGVLMGNPEKMRVEFKLQNGNAAKLVSWLTFMENAHEVDEDDHQREMRYMYEQRVLRANSY